MSADEKPTKGTGPFGDERPGPLSTFRYDSTK
jgi:hypothetical protein